ncbi:MAG: NAD(P)H-hydrate dehydratase [Alphaproteobacteria bacterium]|nr:NAD(P)H-hydrate dehydratase [Alphaproteobacteria bacterium]
MRWPVSTSAQIRALDAHSIETCGVPSLALMETAGRAVTRALLGRFEAEARRGVEVVAGKGNNAGDGYVIARLLHLAGFPVRVLGMGGGHSPDCATMRAAAEGVGVPVREDGPLDPDAGVFVDALLGTGLGGEVRGLARTRIEALNAAGRPVLAVDMPSGLCGDTGRVLGVAVRAALTVTFERPRVGQLLEPGADHVGALHVAEIGLTGPTEAEAWIADGAWVAERLPPRPAASHKGTHGHLAVVAGSPERAGAAILVCEGALASGCGLVTLVIDPAALPRLAQLPPEVMVRPQRAPVFRDLDGFDAVAVGPGFGTAPDERAVLRALWRELPQPAVFDADGLTALADAPEPSAHPRCLTPHPGEAGRLLGISGREVQADRLGAVRALARLAPALLKGRHTLVAADEVFINRTGCPDMAVAGSGDVLTGLIGGLLARGVTPAVALVVGAFVHGHAGELAAPGPLRAGDIARALPQALRSVGERLDVVERSALLA